MDGHTSHINVAISDFARDKNIILYMFPPHASHLLQPLDVAVYGPLKNFWNDTHDAFGKEFRGLHMTCQHFFKVFDKAWKRAVPSPNIKSNENWLIIMPGPQTPNLPKKLVWHESCKCFTVFKRQMFEMMVS